MPAYRGEWSWKTRVNMPRNWRQHIGAWLRRMASNIDGRLNMAWEIETVPRLPVSTVAACLNSGIKHAQRCIEEEARSASDEQILRDACPHLFADELERHRG